MAAASAVSTTVLMRMESSLCRAQGVYLSQGGYEVRAATGIPLRPYLRAFTSYLAKRSSLHAHLHHELTAVVGQVIVVHAEIQPSAHRRGPRAAAANERRR